ncbi:MAG: alpha/beta fold hydrolase [Myxococcota bacterium]
MAQGHHDLSFAAAAHDVAAAIHAHRKPGQRVILAGHSGGAPLMALVQTLYRAGDALALLAAHPSRADILRAWIDGAVRSDGSREPELDVYATATPFGRTWVERYRLAQLERIEHLAGLASRALAEGDPERRLDAPHQFADPRFVDFTLDENERSSSAFKTPPATLNGEKAFMADGTTARAFFEQWYEPTSPANLIRLLPLVRVPVLHVVFGADHLVFPSQSERIAAALPEGAERAHLSGAPHNPRPLPDKCEELARLLLSWSRRVLTQ